MTKTLQKISLTAGLALIATTLSARSELDNVGSKAVPAALIVRVDNKTGKAEAFTSDLKTKVTNKEEAEKAAKSIKVSSKIKNVSYNELDSSSAKQAWGCYYYPRYNYGYYPYSYTYYSYGYYYNYTPYYYYPTTYYSYYYYYRW